MKILFIATLMIPILWTTKTNIFSQGFMKDDDQPFFNHQLKEKYLFEAQKLQEEFCPIFERLLEEGWIENEREKVQDCKKWIDEYDLPLLEKSRQAMQNVTGTDDYLSLWERNFPHDVLTLLSPEESKSTTVPTWNFITETIHRNSGKSAASSPVQYTDHGISLFNVYMLLVR